jgi:GntR family transcriptional regulator
MIRVKIKNDTIALSRLAKQSIIEFIKEERIQPDEQLPSEALLMDMMGVSRYTVREALALLEQDKIIYKVQGKGTFVKKVPVKIESGLEKLESITEIIKSFGYNPNGKCLKIEEITPTQDMIEKLKLNKEDKAITFTRIRTADEKIAAFCVDTVPKYLFKDEDIITLNNLSMFEYFSSKLGIHIEHAVAEIIPTFPTKEMVKLADVGSHELYILLRQIHYDNDGTPVIYSMDYFNPEVFKFKVNRIR